MFELVAGITYLAIFSAVAVGFIIYVVCTLND